MDAKYIEIISNLFLLLVTSLSTPLPRKLSKKRTNQERLMVNGAGDFLAVRACVSARVCARTRTSEHY